MSEHESENIERAVFDNVMKYLYIKGFKLSDITAAVGISHSTLQRRYNNPGELSTSELCAIAKALNVPVQKLMEVENDI